MGLNEEILQVLDSKKEGAFSSMYLADRVHVDHQAVVGAIKSLQCYEDVSETKTIII